MPFEELSPPLSEPVTVGEFREHARIEHSEDDFYIASLLVAARQIVEARVHRALITRTYQQVRTGFAYVILLEYAAPLVTVDEIMYRDTAGDWQTVDPTIYEVDTISTPGRVRLAYNRTWPTPRMEPHNVKIDYTAGFGPSADDVDPTLKLAIMMLATHWYECREAVTAINFENNPMGFDALIAPYRIAYFA